MHLARVAVVKILDYHNAFGQLMLSIFWLLIFWFPLKTYKHLQIYSKKYAVGLLGVLLHLEFNLSSTLGKSQAR